MKFRQVIKILKRQSRWTIDLDYISILYNFYNRHDKGYEAIDINGMEYLTRKDILKCLKQAKTVYIWGCGRYTKLILKLMKYYKDKLIDENDKVLQRLIAGAKQRFTLFKECLEELNEDNYDRSIC